MTPDPPAADEAAPRTPASTPTGTPTGIPTRTPTGIPTRTPRRRSRGRTALLLALLLIGGLIAAAGGFTAYLAHVISTNVTAADLLPEGVPTGAFSPPPETGKGTNVLLIGSDARPGDTVSRSDVMVLVHIPQDAARLHLIHFPRDLYVDIPGRGKNKLNAAYAFGGAPLLVTTLQTLLKIRIDHVAKTDFEGFKAMTDAVGGVRVWAEEASDGTGNGGPARIDVGWNDLDGEKALFFVRERYQLSEGDISRGKRQQAFIKALMLKAISRDVITNPLKIAAFTDAATKNLVVDRGLTTSVMKDYALSLRGIRSGDIVFVTAPFTGFASVPGVGSVDVVDTAKMAALGRAVADDQLEAWTETSVIP